MTITLFALCDPQSSVGIPDYRGVVEIRDRPDWKLLPGHGLRVERWTYTEIYPESGSYGRPEREQIQRTKSEFVRADEESHEKPMKQSSFCD